MRPQHITAENTVANSPSPEDGLTSMRPQHITAENPAAGPCARCADGTSMRPQHITAENAILDGGQGVGDADFNEAAAYHCGKPELKTPAQRQRTVTSMRPQHITAENLRGEKNFPAHLRQLQ